MSINTTVPAPVAAHLRCEYADRPLTVDTPAPRLSWKIGAAGRRNVRQGAYQVQVSRAEGGPADLWDSGRVTSGQSVFVPYVGAPVEAGARAWWRVRVWDSAGGEAPWSEWAWWEAGLLDRKDWRGEWVGAGLVGGPQTSIPSPYLRRAFTAEKPIRRARLYATALGLYEPWLNGRRVGDLALAPGWTDYKTRVCYQAYDVTEMIVPGPNAMGAVLGDGWYCGHIGWEERQQYGDRPRLLAQLVLEYEDGTCETVATDRHWKAAFGPLLEADLLMGESFDARLDLGDWSAPGYDDAAWAAAARFADPGLGLCASPGPPVRPQETLAAIAPPTQAPGGKWIYDLGQNMVGRVRLKITGEAGRTVTLRHAEVLTPEGGLYTENLRGARATDRYTLRGGGAEEVWEPRFTFHGFRYVEVGGYDGTPPQDLVAGVVLHSDLAWAGEFACSDPLVNQLQHNIVWGLKGNFIDIPTDCPQRDERLGWMGDAQVFIETAAGSRDVSGFFAKWLRDVADAQAPDGSLPMVAPRPESLGAEGGPGWADAGVICAWTQHRRYGDLGLLADCYPMLTRWMDQQRATSVGGVRIVSGWQGFGDWLALDGSTDSEGCTPKDLIGTAFFAHSAALLAQIARVLDRPEDAATYDALAADVRAAFLARFAPDGEIAADTQTAHVLALHFGLLPAEARAGAADWLVRDIAGRGGHLSTGFLGTPYLASVLTEAGHLDTAYALLFQKTWPSWLYPVTQGATTIWERWDGWTDDRGFQDVGMNSFNHYAYGAIGAWLYSVVAGLALDPARPGGGNLRLCPRPGGGLVHARATLETPYGPASSAWRLEAGRFLWTVEVPPNATATVRLPPEAGGAVSEIGSGVYEYDAPWPA